MTNRHDELRAMLAFLGWRVGLLVLLGTLGYLVTWMADTPGETVGLILAFSLGLMVVLNVALSYARRPTERSDTVVEFRE